MSENHVLATYQSLVRDHATRFDPALEQLQQLVAQRLFEIHQQEQELVAAQSEALNRLFQSLETDARCLLPTPEFCAFVRELKTAPVPRWYSSRTLTVSEEPSTWLLATLDTSLCLSNYRETEDNNAYDDERTFTLFSYSIALKLGVQERTLEVHTGRYYHPKDQRTYSKREQHEDIYDDVEDMLKDGSLSDAPETLLAEEISCLVGYASTIFALTPRTAKFEYVPPTGEE